MDWTQMETWLRETFPHMAVGMVLEMGPMDVLLTSPEQHVPCAQVQRFDDDVVRLRLSTVVLETPLVTDFSSAGLMLDAWRPDESDDGCTDGQLFSRDHHLVAAACVAWFRDRHGYASVDDLGCEVVEPTDIPRF